jgi:AraC-like DNA-binding protein
LPSVPTVSSGYAKALFDLAVEHGARPEPLLAACALNGRAFDDPLTRIPLETFKTLMRQGKEMSGQPGLALLFGAKIPFDDLSIVGLICRAAPTMESAFDQINRYGRLIIDTDGGQTGDRFQISRRQGRVFIDDTRDVPNEFPELTESTLGRFICGVGRHFPDRSFFLSAEVTHPRPAHSALYEELLGVPVQFGGRFNAMEISENWLSFRINRANNYVFGLLGDQAARHMQELQSNTSVRAEIERRLMPILHTGEIDMRTIAEEMGYSTQTLYRRLKREQTSFKEIVDDLRCKLSVDYLRQGKVTISETAYLVGFSELSAFSRAFKRWTGKTPGQVHKR